MKRLVLYTDGGSRGNQSRKKGKGARAAAAAIITDGDSTLKEQGWYLGDLTNTGLIRGMEMALDLGAEELVCISDSQLMIRQMTGEYRVKNPGLRKLFGEAKVMQGRFSWVSYVHVGRDHPMITKADSLLNDVLDQKSHRK